MSAMLPLQFASPDELDQLHEATIKVLKQTGVAFHLDEAVDIFKQHGVRVDGNVVYPTRRVVEKAIADAPKRFDWFARDPDHQIRVGGDQQGVHIMMDNGSTNMLDADGTRRPGETGDLINLYKLGQASDIVNVVGQVPVDPADMPTADKHLRIMGHLLKHTTKPLFGIVDKAAVINQVFDMVELVIGRKNFLNDNYTIGVSVCALSPLQFSNESCETILAYARRRQPLMVLSCAMAGVTAPLKPLMGTAILQNAEMMAGLVLAQLISPGLPFVYSPASAVANLQTGGYITGAPESNLINIACLQLARERYGLPTRSMAGLTDAKTVDCQAGYETMQSYFTLIPAGAHMINESLGTLDSIMTVSYEKFVIDEELLSRILRIIRGLDTSPGAFDTSLIHDVGIGGSYLTHPNTFAHCRAMWQPSVSNWNSYDAWQKQGAPDLLQAATKRYRQVLASCPELMIDVEAEKALDAFIARHSD